MSLTTPGKHVPIGESQCFDEWCIAVVGVEKPAAIGGVRPNGVFWIVNARVSNRGRGRRQRETGAFVYLVDRDGTTVVLRAGDRMEVLATNAIDDPVDASPALVGRHLFLRGEHYLWCIEEPR